MEFLIITGLSGAGKSRAADVLEDLDYYCVDNMPVALIPRFAEFCAATQGRYEKVALVTDVREKDGFGELLSTLDELRQSDITCRILYMDADVPTLIRRYKESRRPHPLAVPGGTVEDAIRRETELLAPVKERADFVVNTKGLTLGRLQNRLFELLCGGERKRAIDVTVMSFGYKHGLPTEADLVFDARFLPNPFYVDELRELYGKARGDAGIPAAAVYRGGQAQPDGGHRLHRRAAPQRRDRDGAQRPLYRQGYPLDQRQPRHRQIRVKNHVLFF